MREAFQILSTMLQRGDEFDETHLKHLNQEIHRFGTIHEDEEKMTLYIDGLSKTIHTTIAHHPDTFHCRELTFDNLARFGCSEDEVIRARSFQVRPYNSPRTNWPHQRLFHPSNVPKLYSPRNLQRSVSIL